MRKKKEMRRNVILVLMLLLLSVTTATAQVFILDDEFEGTMRNPTEDFGLIVPIEGLDTDQYLPLGDGLLVLAALGGAYLLGKRKKK
jgi:hypothetical protein